MCTVIGRTKVMCIVLLFVLSAPCDSKLVMAVLHEHSESWYVCVCVES
jgi:hypothetical protein